MVAVPGYTDNAGVPRNATGVVHLDKTGNYAEPAARDASGNGRVVGNIAAGSADDGAPVKAGAVYNLTNPTYASGQRVDLQANSRGVLLTQLADGSNQALAFANRSGDAQATNLIALPVNATGYVFNGTTFDRQRGNFRSTFSSEPPLTVTSRSITVGTTAQTLMPANPTRHKFVIKNDTTTDVWINIGGTATAAAGAGNIKIAAGGYFELQGTTQAITIISAASGIAITAYEF